MRHRTALALLIVAALPLTARGQADFAAEAVAGADYLNEVRANPHAFANLSASLGADDVEARPLLMWNNALQKAAERKVNYMVQTGQFAHVLTIDGQQVGMNQWMREAGYPLLDSLPNDATNFECLHSEQGTDPAGIGRRAIQGFLAEGKDGGHVKPILGRDAFWKGCKHVGIGIAADAQGKMYVSVLVGVYDPFHPDAVASEPLPPVPQKQDGQVGVAVSNASLVTVPVKYKSGGDVAIYLMPAGRSVTLPVDAGCEVRYDALNTSAGFGARDENSKLEIPSNNCTLNLRNNGPQVQRITLETLEYRDGKYQLATQKFNMPAGTATPPLVMPKGSRVSGRGGDTTAFILPLQGDDASVVLP